MGEDCDDMNAKYKFESLDVSGGNIYSYSNPNEDMLSGDLSFNDIYDLIESSDDLSFLEKKHAELSFKLDELYDPYMTNDDLFRNLENFAELTTFNDALVKEMIERFKNNNGSDVFTSNNLSSTLLDSNEFSNYAIKIENELKNEVSKIESEGEQISNISPGVVSFSNNGALFSWHGTSEIEIRLNSLTINCNTFSFDVEVMMTDHFGLDNRDLFNGGFAEFATRMSQGMRSWFILQRVRGVKPFRSTVSKTISKSNVNF